jgi:hypothetical protein
MRRCFMLKELFSSSARVQVLSLLLLNPDTKFYQREIETITGLVIRSIQRETEKLEALGVLYKSAEANKVYFQGNRDYSLFPELRRMLLKTVGLKVVLWWETSPSKSFKPGPRRFKVPSAGRPPATSALPRASAAGSNWVTASWPMCWLARSCF